MKTVILTVLILVISLCAKTQVVLNDSSAVASEIITLGQIAKITGIHKNLLDTMFVATAAPAGHSRFFLKTSISLPAEIKNSVEIKGADRIKIYSISQKISFMELAKKANELLSDSLANTEKVKSEIIFEFNESAELNIPLGEYKVELGKIEKKQLRGRVLIPLVIVSKDGGKKTRASINATIKVVADVVVAAKDIARHEKFAPYNLEMRTVDISSLQGTPLFEMPKIDDYLVIGAIREGMIITNRHISPKPVIEQGNPVKMTVGTGMVKVAVWGRARSSGGIGDIIAVENIESNKIVRAKIVSAGLVEIVRGGTI